MLMLHLLKQEKDKTGNKASQDADSLLGTELAAFSCISSCTTC